MRTTDAVSEIGGLLPQAELQASVREATVLWGISADRAGVECRTTPWWLWWNILSVDAPMVAVVWAALFARVSGGRLSAVEASALVLSVWIIYVSDRLLDGWTARNRAELQERYLFCERHRFALAGLVMAATAVVLWLGSIQVADALPRCCPKKYLWDSCLQRERPCLSGRVACDFRGMRVSRGASSVCCVR